MRDAEPADFPSTRYPRVEPRHPEVWIRVGGRWREGRIMKWVHERTPAVDRWLVWASWVGEQPAGEYGWLLYDPEAIRQRDGDEPPEG